MVAKTVHFVLHRNALDARAPQIDNSKSGVSIKKAGDTHLSPASLFPVESTWIGAMVPKRWAKRAVTRNAIKRQIYTISAGFEPQYPHAAFVVRLRREFSRQQFVSATSAQLKEAVRDEVQTLLRAGLQAVKAPTKVSSNAPSAVISPMPSVS